MPGGSTHVTGAIVYGLLVFLGTAGFGFVVAPAIGRISGAFPIATEAEASFSLLTLKAVPFLVGLSAAAALSLPWVRRLRALRRAAVYAGTVLLAWLTGAAIAAAILG